MRDWDWLMFGLPPLILIGTLLIPIFVSPCSGGDFPLVYRAVEGTVQAPPSTRYVRGREHGAEKIAVRLSVARTVYPAHQHDGTLIVECDSTRCATLLPDERHRFWCRVDGRIFTPDVVECYHDALVDP